MATVADLNTVVSALNLAVQNMATAVGGLVAAYNDLKMNAISPASLDPVVASLQSASSQIDAVTASLPPLV